MIEVIRREVQGLLEYPGQREEVVSARTWSADSVVLYPKAQTINQSILATTSLS